MKQPTPSINPRLIRLAHAPQYLGIAKHLFNRQVRPFLTDIVISEGAIAFDRLDLDKWVAHAVQRSERPANPRSKSLWDVNEHQGFTNVKTAGTLTKKYSEGDFAKALKRTTSKRQKRT